MKRSFSSIACLIVAVGLLAACSQSGSSTTPPLHPLDLVSQNGNQLTITGTITNFIPGGFHIQGGAHVGFLHVYTNASTVITGPAPYIGEVVEVTGTGTPGTQLDAASVTQLFVVTGTVDYVGTSYDHIESTSPHCGYMHVNLDDATQYPNGVPQEGDEITATGIGTCATFVNAITVSVDSGTPAPAPTAEPVTPPSSVPAISHITVVIMENYGYDRIVGSGDAPYMNALAGRSASFTNSHGVAHPSEPNYLALFSGSTQGVTTDTCPLTFDADTLANELTLHGYAFEGYAENAPPSGNPCSYAASSSVSSGYLYGRRHIPWSDFSDVNFNAVTTTYGGPSTTLTGAVNFIVPNICNDMHDCGVRAGDAWLAANVPAIEQYDAANNGLLIVTFDEAEYSAANQIYTVFDGPMIKPGSSGQYIDHYSVLRFIEDNFGLPDLGQSAYAVPISGIIQ